MKETTNYMKHFCKSLGKEYSICIIDFEQVIHRDFGNGYDLEISGMNTTRKNKKATLYLWKNKTIIVEKIKDVKQEDIKNVADTLFKKYSNIRSTKKGGAE